MNTEYHQSSPNFLVRLLGIVVFLIGLALAVGGAYLIGLGGSWVYFPFGAGLLFSGLWIFKGMIKGIWLYLAVFIAIVIWAVLETKLNFWAMISRTMMPLVIACVALLVVPFFHTSAASKTLSFGLGSLLSLLTVYFLYQMFLPHDVIFNNNITLTPGKISPTTAAAGNEWRSYGRTGEGAKYAPFDQINASNAEQLEVAWTMRHGDISELGNENQNTPLYIDGVLYHCSPSNILSAIDGSNGDIIWQFDPKADSPFWHRCRGVSYYDPAQDTDRITTLNAQADQTAQTAQTATTTITADEVAFTDTSVTVVTGDTTTTVTTVDATATVASPVISVLKAQDCGPRIIMATIDVRMFAIRAKDGKLCESFGDNGFVDLKKGFGKFGEGEFKPGFLMHTSGTMLAGNTILVGGWVADNVSVGEPSGVVRAYDALTGDFKWAWDIGRLDYQGEPAEGETYTKGTPNVWAPIAYDLDLGLAYLPTGNATPDYYGAGRPQGSEDHASSVVAVDLNTGKTRWKFQTVHHDLWDYDIPAQPTLADFPMPNGSSVPAVIQVTKRGQIFVLDRRDGTPLTKVEERAVPKGDAKGEFYSATQPFSTGFPAVGAKPLAENQAWGMTLLDQLYCRIQFKEHIYKGDFTPPSLKKSIQYPGNNGGPNWGGASVDQERNLLIVNDTHMPITTRLMPREEIDKMPAIDPHGTYSKQYGKPFGFKLLMFMSPLGVPCMQPPYGTVTAIDMASREILWQRPVGTTKEVGPLGLRLGLAINTGMPTLGGTLSTKGGVVFFSGTQDYYLRALNSETGEVIWKGELPTGGQATPITYIDKKSGRQMVVVNAGGAPHNPNDRGDYIVAFALPEK